MDFENLSARYDRWYQSPEGRYLDETEKKLFLKLVKPQQRQNILELGCGTGHNVEFFCSLGLAVSGIEPCAPMLEIAQRNCSPGANLCSADASRLCFEDRSFDIVAIITALEFMPQPMAALREAFRVSRGKVYLGILNKLSIIGINRRVKAWLTDDSIYRNAKFYTIWEIENMVRQIEPQADIQWQSAMFFPFGWHRRLASVDQALSFGQNPFGAFLAISCSKPELAKRSKVKKLALSQV